MTKKSEILFEDPHLGSCIELYQGLTAKINEFAGEFEKIMKSPFDQNVYNQVIDNEPTFKAQFDEMVQGQLSKHDVFLHDPITQAAAKQWGNLMDAFNAIRNYLPNRYVVGLSMQEIRIIDGRAVFNDEDADRIRDRYFLMKTDDPIIAQLKAYTEAHIKSQGALNEFIKKHQKELGIIGNGLWHLFVCMQGYGGFLKHNNDGNLVVDWKVLFKRKSYNDFHQ
jgi:hypothetical protein